MLSIYAQSTAFIVVPITNTEGINPTGDVVQFSFLGPTATAGQANELVPTVDTPYYQGQWQSDMAPYNATILVGPDGGVLALTPGCYLVIVKVTDNPEVPVLFSGPMIVS